MSKKLQNTNNTFSNLLIPLLVLIFNCLSLGYFISKVLILPSGVNYVFLSRFWKYLLVLAAIIYLYFFILVYSESKNEFIFKKPIKKISTWDYLLILLPLTPIVQYILRNQAILSITEALSVLAFFAILSSLYIYILPTILGILGSIQKMMLLGLSFVFIITSMPILSQYFSWYEQGSLLSQVLFFVCSFLVFWFLYSLEGKHVLHLCAIFIFLTNTGYQVFQNEQKVNHATSAERDRHIGTENENRKVVYTPNIYLLIYDAYVGQESLMAYGIDNSSHESFLRDQGFDIYPHTYSIGSETLSTMNSVLDLSTAQIENERSGVSGDGIIHAILKNNGYQTVGLFTSDYFFRGIQPSYDFSIPANNSSSAVHLINAILIGEFRFNLGFDFQTREEYLESKRNMLETNHADPVFIYSHSDLPNHSQNSGKCLFYETEMYAERLLDANAEMLEDIRMINENDPDAIIIIAGDHGPYLTKNCTSTEGEYNISEISRLDIQDRYGVFLAIKWPSEDVKRVDDITVLQDVFPVVLSYIYQDESILDMRIQSLTITSERVSGASVNNGVINGGIHDGEPLFLSGE